MRSLMIAALCMSLLSTAHSQEAGTTDLLAAWRDFYVARVVQYQVSVAGNPEANLKLQSKPLLTYTNPIRGRDQDGAVFVWTRDGRPELLGTIWSIAANDEAMRRTSHEVHSVSSDPLRVICPPASDPAATRAGNLQWDLDPYEERIELPADDARAPQATPPRRLVQMRSIAQQFSAVSVARLDQTERPLRLMTSPLTRYASLSQDVVDGCVFAFVLATDPELLLLVEAVANAADKSPQWRIIPVRFTGTEIRLKHNNKEIWKTEQINYNNQSGPYRLRVGVTVLPAARS